MFEAAGDRWIGRTYWIEISIEKQAVAIQPTSVSCLAIRPILRDRAAEFFRSSEKGSPATPRLDRDFLTICEAIILDGPAKSRRYPDFVDCRA
ncbi:MAG: hypothetical protein AB1547_03340 [Thermodesulfobacteriota bacterium]